MQMQPHQMSLFDMLETPAPVVASQPERKTEEALHPMASLVALAPPADVVAVEVEEELQLPPDPMTPPITGDNIPPVICRVFVKQAWQRQQHYFGYLYGYKTYSGTPGRYGIVALDGQDYRKGYFYIHEVHLVQVKES